jgi:hypothetical protein
MRKLILRFSPIIILTPIVAFRTQLEFYDILLFCTIILNAILSYQTRLISLYDKYYSLINYIIWLIFILTIVFIRSVPFDYVVFSILLIRFLILILNYYKFQNFYVPRTILDNIWGISLVVYLSELVLNSTHGTKGFFILLGEISTIEMLFILLLLKEWNAKINSILTILKRKLCR